MPKEDRRETTVDPNDQVQDLPTPDEVREALRTGHPIPNVPDEKED